MRPPIKNSVRRPIGRVPVAVKAWLEVNQSWTGWEIAACECGKWYHAMDHLAPYYTEMNWCKKCGYQSPPNDKLTDGGHHQTPTHMSQDAMKTRETQSRRSVQRLVRRLDSAYAELFEARKIAALSKHESYEEIGDAIECVEAAFVWLHKSPNKQITH